MKLKQIKLAGFKSFVDPTKIPFEKALTGIVGPNGCGKSNVIDAVRWVLGESSAKHLRGGAMTDVIFSGSNARKPVSVASVELSFDNQDGRLAGQYSSYQEVSVKRQVSRDGDSLYFLNGQKCRRKDITDLFMGTGLGPRSYAIIEQGMISRLIESKPQDLRVFIEEAAGISRYKERRRDTENRIRHTRENLERLFDIRSELDTQLKKLAAQSKSALKYREFKKTERKLHAELLVLKYTEHTTQVDETTVKINQLEIELEKINAEVESTKSQLTKLSLDLSELNSKEQHQVETYYQTGTEIARLEQQKTHQQQLDKKLLEQLEKTERQKEKLDSEQKELNQNSLSLENEVKSLVEEQQIVQEQLDEQKLTLESALASHQALSEDEKNKRQQLSEVKMQLQLQQTQREHKKQNLVQYNEQLHNIKQQLQTLEQHTSDISSQQSELEQESNSIAAFEKQLADKRQRKLNIEGQVTTQQQLQKTKEKEITEVNSRVQIIQEWLNSHQNAESPIWQVIKVNKGWEKSVELLIGHLLTQEFISTKSLGDITGFEKTDTAFSNKIIDAAPLNLAPWFANVQFVDTQSQAQNAVRNSGDLILTKDGYLVGENFTLEKQSSETSQLSLQAEQTELMSKLDKLKVELSAINEKLAQTLQQQNLNNDEFEHLKEQIQHHGLKRSSLLSSIAAANEQQQKDLARKQELESHLKIVQDKIESINLDEEVDDEKHQQLLESIEVYSKELSDIEATLQQQQTHVQQLKNKVNELQHRINAEQIEFQQKQTQLAINQQRISQNQQRLVELETQLTEIQYSMNLDDEVSPSSPKLLEKELKALVQKHSNQQSELTATRQQQSELQVKVTSINDAQKQVVQKQQALVEQISELKLKREGIKGQINSQLELLKEENVDVHSVMTELTANADIEQWHQELEIVKQRIARLGAINLTAIEEYEQQKERKDYLDKQNDDLTAALESLESAIRKIDRETRSRFKETYEKVNNDLQMLFPKVFGGGSAYLELTDDDLLETGITIMARPPGKKNSTIHLLSGGEKALTALSLVFAIFRLNPAPFCMLDEVDAPLDDANVERFCRLLEEMSQTVQFIYISHNKITMEMADQLIGVTMHEPGVSRIVAVDVDEAVALADVG